MTIAEKLDKIIEADELVESVRSDTELPFKCCKVSMHGGDIQLFCDRETIYKIAEAVGAAITEETAVSMFDDGENYEEQSFVYNGRRFFRFEVLEDDQL